jgi:hypothetical protein
MAAVDTLRVCTLNALRSEVQAGRYARIVAHFEVSEDDVIALQEVSGPLRAAIEKSAVLLERYEFAPPRNAPDDTAMLVRRSLAPTFQYKEQVANDQRRSVILCCLTLGQRRVCCATAHLLSKFFSVEFTAIKAAQLLQIGTELGASGAPAAFMMGDCNLTGGAMLTHENCAIASAGLSDAWLALHPTNEDQQGADWRDKHCTWDYRNPLVKHDEYHRPDRVFLLQGLTPVAIERLVGEPTPLSDHYGLVALLRVDTQVVPKLDLHFNQALAGASFSLSSELPEQRALIANHKLPTLGLRWSPDEQTGRSWYWREGCLFNRATNLVLAVADGVVSMQSMEQGNHDQLWDLEAVGDDVIRIVFRSTAQVLDVDRSVDEDGARLILWPWRNKPNQKWKLRATS